MNGNGRRLVSLLLSLLLMLGCGAGLAFADRREYPSVRLYRDGLLTGRAYRSGETLYLSVEDVCAFLGKYASGGYDPIKGLVAIRTEALEVSAENGEAYVEINGRYLFNPDGFLKTGNRVYFPAGIIEQIFNIRVERRDGEDKADLDLEQADILQGGHDYYKETFGADNVLWLSRIISSEAGNQPMAGMIGVGNVVLNRVKSDRYPNTIFDVVFDTKNGVQFGPVLDGSIYEESGRLAVIAACLCLEGVNTVGDSLFFVASAYADDTWFRANRTFVTSIGNHDFYA